MIYVLCETEQDGEHWRLARFDPSVEHPPIDDLAAVPFQSRSLIFDGEQFWSNHRPADTMVSFALP